MRVQTARDAELDGQTVLVRVDFNVPLDGGRVADDARIRAALPTIRHLVSGGARVVLMSHLGRPKGKRVPGLSLAPVAEHLAGLLETDVVFAKDCVGDAARRAVAGLRPGAIAVLENLRFHAEETDNDPAFAKSLAGLADAYVNDAFGTAHRAHASTVGVAAHLPSYAGFLIEKEIRLIGNALEDPERPFTAVLGGAKVSDKIGVIQNLLGKVDHLVIGGGMAFTFLKAQGHEVGKSLVEEGKVGLAGELLKAAAKADVDVLLPADIVAADAFAQDARHRVVSVAGIKPDWVGLDIGPVTASRFAGVVRDSGTVVWNGPMGVFEWDAFAAGTKAVADAMAACRGTTIVGGGDTAAAAARFGITDAVTHVSTGGGASLELLEGKTLPGIAALEAAARRMASPKAAKTA